MAERMTVRGAAALLQRSERSVRRYLHEGRLDAERVDMFAGGWQWLIDKASAEQLRQSLQGGTSRGSSAGVDELTAEVQALRRVVEAQSEQISAMQQTMQRTMQLLLLPAPPRKHWWRFWQRGDNQHGQNHS